ncbi:MAG: shikimate dehydrogenase, partial [Nocardioidaceae bacterium]
MLGSPIAHSLSPALHRAAYDALGLDWSYQAVEVGADGLAAFLDGLDRSWRGVSLTMPLKRAVLPLLDEVSEVAQRAGAANTVLLDAGRRRGDNTDVPGAVAAVRERYADPVGSVLVVGGGATAASLVLAVAEMGASVVTFVVRDLERARDTVTLAEGLFGRDRVRVSDTAGVPAASYDLLVSTVPASAQDAGMLAAVEAARLVFDVGYHPWPTPVAERAAALGVPVVSGLDLLVHQAALQVELMTGLRV